MKTRAISHPALGLNGPTARGSVLVTAMIFSIIIGITLVGYIKLSTNSLKLAHRSFFADEANNIAEAGTEEAVWSFNQMGNSTNATVIANAWSGWSLGNTVADAYVTSGGTGYTSAPTVTISGGGGTGATGTASITTYYVTYNSHTTSYTAVSGITITNPGSGYTTAPAITLSGGGGSGATAEARLAATKTITFNNLDQNATGTVKVWVAGYNGTATIPIAVAKATITPVEGAPIVKYVKIIVSKSGLLPKGLIAKNAITWNGHPIANSYKSSNSPGVPPFANYDAATARANTTVGSLYGPSIDLGAQGVVSGNVMLGPGVTLTGSGTVTGQTIGNLSYNFTMPTFPTNSGATSGYDLGSSLPATLPRTSGTPDTPATDGKYYYYVHSATIGATTITAGKNVVIVGNNGTNMVTGLKVPADNSVSPAVVGKAEIYMDGTISLSGTDNVNKIASPNTSWAGALTVYTTTSATCTMSGNAAFYGSLVAPNAQLTGNGGGNDTTDLCGSFVVGSVTSNGHLSFHYDEGLASYTNPRTWSLALWTELQSAADRALYESKFNF